MATRQTQGSSGVVECHSGNRTPRSEKSVAHPHFANLLLHLFAAAKLDPCGPLRFFRRHARTGVFLDQHFEVRRISWSRSLSRRARKGDFGKNSVLLLGVVCQTPSTRLPKLSRWPRKSLSVPDKSAGHVQPQDCTFAGLAGAACTCRTISWMSSKTLAKVAVSPSRDRPLCSGGSSVIRQR